MKLKETIKFVFNYVKGNTGIHLRLRLGLILGELTVLGLFWLLLTVSCDEETLYLLIAGYMFLASLLAVVVGYLFGKYE